MAKEDNIKNVTQAQYDVQKTSTQSLDYQKLGLDIADVVNSNSAYMLNAAKLQIQGDMIEQTNSWLELQKQQTIRQIENKTGTLVSSQIGKYGYSGVTMSGSALDVTLAQIKEGELAKIYAGINAQYTQLQNSYHQEQINIQKRAGKRAQTASLISSVSSIASDLSSGFGGK